MSTRNRRVVLGITGSIAATKSQSTALALKHCGFEVRVCMTHSAQKVLQTTALSSVLSDPVYSDMWVSPNGHGEAHVEWAAWADAMLIAPATASCISSLWQGSYDSTVTLVAGNILPSKLFLAPAMSQEMWEQPAVVRNVATLKDWGVNFLGPVQGKVASGGTGQRLMESRDLAASLNQSVSIK